MQKNEIIGWLLAIVLMATVSSPAWAANAPLTPVDIPYSSPEEDPDGPFPAGSVIDGIYGPDVRNMGVFNDDTPLTADPYVPDEPITGHLVFDLGQNYDVYGSTIWERGNGGYMPESVDFYYFVDNDPTNIQGDIDDIENDANIDLLWSGNLLSPGGGIEQTVSFTAPVNTRYVGMRVNSGFGNDGFQIGEQAFMVPQEQLPPSPVLITPTAVVDHSGTEADPYTADKIIDGIAGPGGERNMAVFTDDTEPVSDPITGHVILDLGSQKDVTALKIWARGDTTESLLPKDMQVFYYADDDWSNNALVDDIEGDTDIISIWSGTLIGFVTGGSQTIDFESSITARYIGLRIDSSYGWDSFQIGEVALELDSTSLLPGDANSDGVVDSLDASILASNWQGTNKGWGQGDFNGDGKVDDVDATILASNWQSASAASVPEPGSAALLLGMVFAMLGLCRFAGRNR